MEAIIIAFATAFSILIIKVKIQRKRYEDATFDCCLLILLTLVFHGTFSGMIVAAVTSMMISLYFFISPPVFITNTVTKIKSFIKEMND